MLKPRDAVQKMAPYSPPTGDRAGKLRLDFNENTIGCSPHVIDFITRRLTADQLSMYPDYTEAFAELAAFFNVSPTELAITNGTDEAIQLLVNTFVNAGDDVRAAESLLRDVPLLCEPRRRRDPRSGLSRPMA